MENNHMPKKTMVMRRDIAVELIALFPVISFLYGSKKNHWKVTPVFAFKSPMCHNRILDKKNKKWFKKIQ